MNDLLNLQASVNQASQMLIALRDPTCSAHKSAMEALTTQSTSADFIYSIFQIFSRSETVSNNIMIATGINITIDLRQLSGFIIKNYILPHIKTFPKSLQIFIHQETVQALSDVEAAIRNTAANYIGRITSLYPEQDWHEMIITIINNLKDIIEHGISGTNTNTTTSTNGTNGTNISSSNTITTTLCKLDGYTSVIKIICEDATQKIFDSVHCQTNATGTSTSAGITTTATRDSSTVSLIDLIVPLLL